MRRVGVLLPAVANDPEYQARVGAFAGAALLGWTDGRNVRIETRWGASDADRYRQYAAELVALAPDVILSGEVARRPPDHCYRRLEAARNGSI
jgi:putative ABC transport system substrate-binding protein